MYSKKDIFYNLVLNNEELNDLSISLALSISDDRLSIEYKDRLKKMLKQLEGIK